MRKSLIALTAAAALAACSPYGPEWYEAATSRLVARTLDREPGTYVVHSKGIWCPYGWKWHYAIFRMNDRTRRSGCSVTIGIIEDSTTISVDYLEPGESIEYPLELDMPERKDAL